MKVCVFLVFALAVLASVCASSKNKTASHSVTWGTRSIRDVHLKREVIYEKSRKFRKVSGDFVFDQKNVLHPKIITQVIVTDQYTNGKGGYASLTSGGPHMTDLKIRFNSKRSHGFNFIVDIYGTN